MVPIYSVPKYIFSVCSLNLLLFGLFFSITKAFFWGVDISAVCVYAHRRLYKYTDYTFSAMPNEIDTLEMYIFSFVVFASHEIEVGSTLK